MYRGRLIEKTSQFSMRIIKSYDCDKLPFDSSCTERSATMSLDEMIPYCMFGITRYLSFEHRDTNSTEIRTVHKGARRLHFYLNLSTAIQYCSTRARGLANDVHCCSSYTLLIHTVTPLAYTRRLRRYGAYLATATCAHTLSPHASVAVPVHSRSPR